MSETRPDLWAFIRSILLHGAVIERDCRDLPYEQFSARIDAADRRRTDEWLAQQNEADDQ